VKRILSDQAKADAIGEALAARFTEVIVDEAQDCNADDVAVLHWLKRHGIPLLVLCDPDQAIFGFRKGTNEALRTFVQDFPPLTLNGNFRSSKVICSAAGTMRARGTTDLAVGDYHDTIHPIILMPYGKTAKLDIGAKFMALTATSV
jgi:superfamily I DNA/RNA helicase